MSYSTKQIRNVALAGHSGAGKTTLFEALLFAGGAIPAAGSLERGSTVSDFDPMEKARGHSLNTAIASTDHAGIHVNLVDTPGYPDFRGPTLSAFSAVETVAVVVNAATGVEYGTRRMMDYARQRNLCRVLVVTKMDAEPGRLAALLEFQTVLGVALVAGVYLVGQLIESLYLTPRLLGERIGLHPIAVIFALLAFGHLFGFVGVLIALPASAVLLVAIRRARTTYLNSPLYRESASDGSGRPDRPD